MIFQVRRAEKVQTLLPIFPTESTRINEVLSFEKREGTVWYFHGCMPVFSHNEKDYASFNMYTSQLVVLGQCRQVEIVKAFGVSTISVKRHVKKYRKGGPCIFFKERSVRKFAVLTPAVLTRAQELLNDGKSRDEVSELKSKASDLGLRMFARWCQENFFKYMMEHFNIDRLMCYKVERTDETKKVVNPAYRKIEWQVKSGAGKLGRKLRQFADLSANCLIFLPNYI